MARKKIVHTTVEEKLNHKLTVLLKEWAGQSGFFGYKDMDFEQVLALVNTAGWKTELDDSDPSVRSVRMVKEDTVRKAKFILDDKGRVIKID
ncbi:hypothetical protein SAMN04487969_10722 [Paenibacillus algorifonticola]|uniref:Uncharacterized protein n=1 Tax=Paenibacillus algorifonticola TaxID=684063 RepID=A0A1I2DIB4_9BACL|nr:hypothetical protein [Paenibacillus algorifonticola]SFE80178.1 hypothetical protein SAMN04487969_10722 [Paenibacillus algorifonticola]